MNKEIAFGIVGCGRISEIHASNMALKGRLVAVCDIVQEKADKLAKKFGAKAYYDYQKMLASEPDLQLVSVCTANGQHAHHSILALQNGCHVLCEKPMALNVEDCRKMIEVSETNNRKLFIVKQNRYNPPVKALKKSVEDGLLGKIYSIQLNCFWNRNDAYYQNTWKGTKSLDGGTLFTQFSHFIDLLYWMFGEVAIVEAYIGNYGHIGQIEIEDTGVVILKFEKGAIGTINYTTNSHDRNFEGSLTVFGEKGTVKVGGQYLNKLEYQSIENGRLEIPDPGKSANNYGDYQGSMSNHDKVFENIIEVLCRKGDIMTSAGEGMKTVEIINRIYAAALLVN
ncbi:Gfo/Idh/MocA family protein [Flavitalea antarctica]